MILLEKTTVTLYFSNMAQPYLEVSSASDATAALIRKFRQTHWSLMKWADMWPQFCSTGPCRPAPLEAKTEIKAPQKLTLIVR